MGDSKGSVSREGQRASVSGRNPFEDVVPEGANHTPLSAEKIYSLLAPGCIPVGEMWGHSAAYHHLRW